MYYDRLPKHLLYGELKDCKRAAHEQEFQRFIWRENNTTEMEGEKYCTAVVRSLTENRKKFRKIEP